MATRKKSESTESPVEDKSKSSRKPATAKATSAGKKEVNFTALNKITPYNTTTQYESKTFTPTTGYDFPRYAVETVNQIRQLDIAIKSEKNTFLKSKLTEQRAALMAELNQYDHDKIELSIKNIEQFEENYWIQALGKRAALELLCQGKVSVDTMEKMIKLPEDAYIKASQVCVKLANSVRDLTAEAEQSIGVSTTE
jgi:hypothetical protein